MSRQAIATTLSMVSVSCRDGKEVKRTSSALERLAVCDVLVFGDFFLDAYTLTRADRLSPEAPVPILQHAQEFARAGGAGNVALNLRALGNRVWALGRVGCDPFGRVVADHLEGIDTSGLQSQSGYQTPHKHRVLADHQQLLRIDQERVQPLSKDQEDRLLEFAARQIARMQALAISDYGKGACTPRIVAELIELARAVNCPVIVDPKGGDWVKYNRADVIKPNLAELRQTLPAGSSRELEPAARAFFERCPGVDWLLVTKGELGMSLFSPSKRTVEIPALERGITDVTGAGDTALAALTHSWACRLDPLECAQLANAAASIAVTQLGCAQVGLAEIAQSLFDHQTESRIWAAEPSITLDAVLKARAVALISLWELQLEVDHLAQLVEVLCRAKKRGEKAILQISENSASLSLLASLRDVDLILIGDTRGKDLMRTALRVRHICWRQSQFVEVCGESDCI